MIPEERRTQIINKLKKQDICTISSLIREFGVSRVTIQRDLSLLEKSELVSKVHGGVKLKKEVNKNFETRFNIRLKQNYEKKLEIAKKAVNFVSDEI